MAYKAPTLQTPKATSQLNSDNKINISWNKVTGASSYKVYRATSSSGSYKVIKTTNSTSYVDASAKASTTYYYKVKAIRGESSSAYSNTVNGRWELDINTIRAAMLNLINEEREKVGVDPLEIYSPINYTAQEKAEDLHETGVFDHYSDNLGMFYDQYEKAGITYSGGGENIACGYSDVKAVMKGWMQSPGHKANILKEKWTHVGIGYYKGNWVQQFVMDPKGGYAGCVEIGLKVTCPECGKENLVKEYKMYSEDSEGNTYGCFYCSSCGEFIEKCPKCEKGIFVAVGLNTGCRI